MTRPFTRVFREAVELRIMAEREEMMRETRGRSLRTEREAEIGQMRAVIASAEIRRRVKSEREVAIAGFREAGLTTREIAQRLSMSERQVRHYESAFPVMA